MSKKSVINYYLLFATFFIALLLSAPAVAQVTYSNNFDNNVHDWNSNTTGNASTNWEEGFPNFGATSVCHSGWSCWDVNLVQAYTPDAYTTVTSPTFQLNNLHNLFIGFWLSDDTYNDAAVWMEYSTDSINWNRIGTVNDPLGSNWYNANTSWGPAWSTSFYPWAYATYSLTVPLCNYIQLRFVFVSDTVVTGTSFTFDDFSLSITTPIESIKDNNTLHLVYYASADELNLSGFNSNNQTVDILDAAGRIVLHQNKNRSKQFTVNTDLLASGYYLVKLNDGKQSLSASFVKP